MDNHFTKVIAIIDLATNEVRNDQDVNPAKASSVCVYQQQFSGAQPTVAVSQSLLPSDEHAHRTLTVHRCVRRL